MTNVQNDLTTLTKDAGTSKSWFLQHERLIIVFLVLLVTFFVLDKGLGVVAEWEQHRASVAAAQVAVDKEKADTALAEAKNTLEEYQTLLSQTQSANIKLQEGIQSRDELLAAQQKKDVTLPPSALADRWSGLVGDSGIQPNTSGFTVSDTAALATVSKLEQVPVLEQDLKDAQSKSANLQQNVDKATDLIGQGKVVVSGLQLQLQDQTKSCETQIKAVKAEARKGKLKWFGIGYLAGLTSGVVLHFF
jgi:hypothetical protein